MFAFGGDLAVQLARVEKRNFVDSVFAVFEGVPKRFDTVAERGNYADTGYYDTFLHIKNPFALRRGAERVRGISSPRGADCSKKNDPFTIVKCCKRVG